jgi:hypothetical protein
MATCPDCGEPDPCACDAADHDWECCSCAHCDALRADRGTPDPAPEDWRYCDHCLAAQEGT